MDVSSPVTRGRCMRMPSGVIYHVSRGPRPRPLLFETPQKTPERRPRRRTAPGCLLSAASNLYPIVNRNRSPIVWTETLTPASFNTARVCFVAKELLWSDFKFVHVTFLSRKVSFWRVFMSFFLWSNVFISWRWPYRRNTRYKFTLHFWFTKF